MPDSTWPVVVLPAVVYVATIPVAWKMLAVLTARSASEGYSLKQSSFWLWFIAYRFVIFAPYGVLLLLGQHLPGIIRQIIWGWIIFGLLLSCLRFIGSSRIIPFLWWIYGFVYDGLNYLYPYRHLLSETQRRLKIAPGDSVLDLGCGTGNLTRLINQNHDVKVVAIDGSTSMLGTLKRKLRSQIKQGQVEVVHSEILEFLRRQPDKTFDRIAMVNVVYAVSDRMRLWEEVVRVLKPSGIAVATTSDRTGSWPIIKEHWRNDTKIKLFHPKLLMVSIIDAFISEFSKTSVFNFVPQEELFDEVKAAGGKPSNPGRTYGGDKEGVNIIFDVRRS